MVLIKTDLPAPLSPARAVTWPAGTSRSMSTNARTAPKLLLTPLRLRSGVEAAAPSGPAVRSARLGPGLIDVPLGQLIPAAVQALWVSATQMSDALAKPSLMTV